MEKKDRGMYVTFRLSPENQQHIKIYDFLKSDEIKKYGSKNKFIADALNYYIGSFGEKSHCSSLAYAKNENLIDISELKKEILIEVQREVLSLLTSNQVTSTNALTKNEEDDEEVDKALDSMFQMWED